MNSRTYLKTGVAALLLAPALASAYSYNYLEGGYLNRDQAGSDSGFRVAGAFDVFDPVALIAEFDHVDSFDQISVGALYHMPLQRGLDLNLGATFENFDYSHGSDSGLGLRAGLRWQLPQTKLELNPELRYVSVGDEDGMSLRVAALYPVAPKLKLQGSVQFGDDDRFDLGVRYEFGPGRM